MFVTKNRTNNTMYNAQELLLKIIQIPIINHFIFINIFITFFN